MEHFGDRTDFKNYNEKHKIMEHFGDRTDIENFNEEHKIMEHFGDRTDIENFNEEHKFIVDKTFESHEQNLTEDKSNLNLNNKEKEMNGFDIAQKLIKERNIGNNRFGIEDSGVNTNLISKNYSPMIIRKYNLKGWPLFVSLICDWDLSDLDKIVNQVKEACEKADMISNNIQSLRNFTGVLSETIIKYYDDKKKGCVEGVAVVLYTDKFLGSSIWGDHMTHLSCKVELMGFLNMLPHV